MRCDLYGFSCLNAPVVYLRRYCNICTGLYSHFTTKSSVKVLRVAVHILFYHVFLFSPDETVKIELIQLIPPGALLCLFSIIINMVNVTSQQLALCTSVTLCVSAVVGESLAHIEQDVRQFLFPEPKLVPPSPGVDREVLMMRASNFPGIAPRLEFSTRTTIRDCPLTAEKRVFPNVLLSSSSRRSCGRKTQVPRSKATSAARRRPSCGAVGCGKRQPQTPRCHSPGWHASARDGSRGARLLSKSASGLDFLNDDAEDATTRVGRSRLERWSPPGPERPLSPPALKISHRESMSRNGFRTGPPHIWDVVHERVQRLLNTSRAMRQLSNGSVESEVDDVMRRSITPQPRLP
ncbi:spermatogenesis associated 6-like protein isoform X2 [Scleropages formosus]|uniref:spermatogenesis associated 6-like protein isoform X2 n=1 Tax=Scleropages formosus TaxID=113540 RepID=UPI0010FA876B|nr:spermatogenesis associated 6-like protein isoform X2 [Scleropages formosus]